MCAGAAATSFLGFRIEQQVVAHRDGRMVLPSRDPASLTAILVLGTHMPFGWLAHGEMRDAAMRLLHDATLCPRHSRCAVSLTAVGAWRCGAASLLSMLVRVCVR